MERDSNPRFSFVIRIEEVWSFYDLTLSQLYSFLDCNLSGRLATGDFKVITETARLFITSNNREYIREKE